MMEDNVVQKIKDKLDIVEVIGSYIKLQKTGINYRAVCPFHSEKKPSFFVSPARQMFKCFGCGASGSIFDFVMKIEGVEFGDALKILAHRAGVELKSSRYNPELKTARQRLYELCELSSSFFEKQLQASAAGKEVKKYFLERGLDEESIKKWRLGYAPDKWRALSDFLVGQGYKREEIIKAGLAIKKEGSNNSYDRFRGRIMFPVFDLNSQVIAFGGRVLPGKEDSAKYINTPNTLLYDKSRVLYGLNFAKVEIRKKDFVILTEGYMDVILSQQAGAENTVSSSGTALTPWQLKILKRYTNNLFISFDMDNAGELATNKGIGLAQKEDFTIKVIQMPQGKDPADMASEDPKGWQELIKKAEDIFNFYFQYVFSRYDRESPEGKKEISRFLLSKIKEIPNKIVQAHWIQKMARSLGLDEEPIWEELKRVSVSASASKGAVSSLSSEEPSVLDQREKKEEKGKKRLLEERILSLAVKTAKNLNVIKENDLLLFSPEVKTIISLLKKEKGEDKAKSVLEKIEKDKSKENLKKILDEALLMAEIEDFGAEKGELNEGLKEETELCLQGLKKIALKNKLSILSQEIRLAERDKEEKKLKELSEEFNRTSKELKTFI